MSTRRSGRSRSQSRSRRDEEEAGSEPAPAPSPARLAGSESESEFEESQEADERVLERAEELEKIKEQQRETREGLAALRQRFEDQGAAAAESQAEVKGLLQQLLAGSGTSAGSAAGGGTARAAQGEDGVRGRIESAPGIAPAVSTLSVPPLPSCPSPFRPLPIAVPSAATTNM